MSALARDRPPGDPHVVVVGGGVVGLLTAFEAVQAGAAVTLIEQGDLPNMAATSHDHHRIVRALHVSDRAATATGLLARERWAALGRRLSAAVCHRTGCLTVLGRDGATAAADLGLAAGVETSVIAADRLAARFPNLRLEPDATGVLEPDGLVVLADRALEATVRWLAGHPGTRLLAGHQVTSIDPVGAAAELVGGRVVHGDALVVAAGPYSRTLIPAAIASRLVLFRQTVVYCDVPATARAAWRASPATLGLGHDGGTWLVPPVAGTPLKVSATAAARPVAATNAGNELARWRRLVVERCREAVTEFDSSWVTSVRDCHYLADRTTGGPLLTTLVPGRAWAFAACGGSSFKFAPLLASALVDAVLDGANTCPHPFDPVASIATTTDGARS